MTEDAATPARPRAHEPDDRAGRRLLIPALLLLTSGVAAGLVVAVVVQPAGPTTIDPDAAASVLYFQRIIGGHRLETFVPTTPKPLLTLVYGTAWAALGDWRVLTWLTLGLFALSVPLAVAWTWRTIRPVATLPAAAAGAAFAGAALAASSTLALEVSRANSLVWALVGWLVAGLAMGTRPRRAALAGGALLLAGLARTETLLLVGGAALALLAVVVRSRSVGSARRSGQAGDRPPGDGRDDDGRLARDLLTVVLLGALAVPLACLHDLLLTGDPLFWIGVPARYTEVYAPSVVPSDVGRYLAVLAARLRDAWPVVVAAVVGAAWLILRRRWVAVAGLGSLAAGEIVLLTALALRGTYISARYYEPLDLALLALAAAGLAGVTDVLARAAMGWPGTGGRSPVRRPDRRGGDAAGNAAPGTAAAGAGTGAGDRPASGALLGPGLAAAAGLLLGVAAVWPAAPFDRAVASSLALVRASSVALEGHIERLTADAGPAVLPADVAAGAPVVDPAGVSVFVPSLLRSRIAVEGRLPLTALGDTYASYLGSPAWSGLHAGQRIYHDAAADRPAALGRALEADPARLGTAVARPELVDAATGVRILRVESP